MQLHFSDAHEGIYNPGSKSSPMPRRSPPPTPSGAEPARHVSPPSQNSRTSESGAPLGAFWTTQHVHDSVGSEEKTRPKFDEGLTSNSSSRHDGTRSDRTPVSLKSSPLKGETLQLHPVQKNVQAKPADGPSKDFEIKIFQGDLDHGIERPKAPETDSKPASQGDAFDAFVAEFGNNKRSPKWNIGKSEKEDLLEAEIEKLKQQLEQVNTEKAEMTSKYEKLSAICRSQRQEIQELKQSLAARTPSPGRDASRNQASPSSQPASILPQGEKIEGTVWELQQGFDQSTQIPEPKPWQAFTDDRKSETASINNVPRSVRTGNDHQNRQAAEVNSRSSTWGFVSDNFRAAPAATSQMPSKHGGKFGKSQRFGESKNTESTPSSQPSGWAGF